MSNAAFITVQAAVPNLILVPVVKPLPVRVKTVPPLMLPDDGLIDFKLGMPVTYMAGSNLDLPVPMNY